MARVWNEGHRFSGRVVLVTGAGGTLGGAVAGAFGGEGASVVFGYRPRPHPCGCGDSGCSEQERPPKLVHRATVPAERQSARRHYLLLTTSLRRRPSSRRASKPR
jgi:NAD(P)-dependent dehydrogenase (short-subunit alcohol dehydrogenase family)